ncbi:MAG TPA: ATP-binding protein [Myxococcales bacterium]|nr:ATP-binding protein [Myxococcales bacterium]
MKSAGISLRWTLSAVISLMALAIVSAVSIVLIASDNRVEERDLQHKATLYAGVFSEQLQSAIAYDDTRTAEEIIAASVRLDEDLESVALYRADGSLLQKVGEPVPAPWAASPGSAQLRISAAALEALAPVISREGPRGVVVLRLTRAALMKTRRLTELNALMVGAVALIFSLLVAWLVAGWVTSRLARIATAARTVASGDLTQPPLDVKQPGEIRLLALSFNGMVDQLRKLIDARGAAAEMEQHRLEQLVVERTAELAARNQDLEKSHDRYRLIVESTNAIPWEYNRAEKRFTYVGPQAVKLLGHSLDVWKNLTLLRSLVDPHDLPRIQQEMTQALKTGASIETELRLSTQDGRKLELRCVANPDNGCLRGLLIDVTLRKRLETDLQQAQKLESVGRLAAGIAHEINTPVQFVGDSLTFLKEAFDDLLPLLATYRTLKEQVDRDQVSPRSIAEVDAAEESSDITYLAKQVPLALARCGDGLDRVIRLLRSMKEYSHPDQTEKVAANLNEALATTLTLARNEYKYVAELETSYGNLPPVLCHVNELNQAFLNIIVNSAHAISDVVQGSGKKGVIRVATRVEADQVVVAISDTGGGVPDSIRGKIFDPFFTTKPAGKGTGQGLSIAHNLVVVKHGGTITLDSELGRGATFTIRLPLKQAAIPFKSTG